MQVYELPGDVTLVRLLVAFSSRQHALPNTRLRMAARLVAALYKAHIGHNSHLGRENDVRIDDGGLHQGRVGLEGVACTQVEVVLVERQA